MGERKFRTSACGSGNFSRRSRPAAQISTYLDAESRKRVVTGRLKGAEPTMNGTSSSPLAALGCRLPRAMMRPRSSSRFSLRQGFRAFAT